MQYPANYAALHFAIPPQSDRQLWSAEPEGAAKPTSAPLFNRARVLYSALHYRKNRRGARRVVSTGLAACGWLRGTSRTSPGPPRRWQRPVWLRSTSARGRGFAAYLSACGGQPLQRPRCGLRQGGLRSLRSASSLSFLVTCQRQVIPSHSFAALTALVVRRENGDSALFVHRVR